MGHNGAAALRRLAALLALGLATASAAAWRGVPAPRHFADADDPAAVARGRVVYARTCAACHGRALQGQPLWQLADQYAGRRAPAHDPTGHTWQHGDDALFAMAREGRWPGGPASNMPAFAGVLPDQDIAAALAFIKASWPVGLRALQAMRNPGQAGMPAGASAAGWTIPPNCMGAVQRAAQASGG